MKNAKFSEHTANLAMGYAPAIVATVGRNFAKSIPRLAAKPVEKSFIQRLLSMKKRV